MRDTPLEKNNHELTPRHQGNLKRFLRDLHRENEAGARAQQRAKDEAARLNGTATTSSTASAATGARATAASAAVSGLRNATPEERKRQMAQLAEMGVSVPAEFRKENAMAGDWEVVSQRVITPDPTIGDTAVKQEENKDAVSVGIRKRKADGDDEEEAEQASVRRRKWGTDVKALPDDEADLDALLGASASTVRRKPIEQEEVPVKKEESPAADVVKSEAPTAENSLPSAIPPTWARSSKSGSQEPKAETIV